MFGWFKPTCPCDPAAKRWVEAKLHWLSRQFGLHLLLERPVILPIDRFFPDPYDGTAKAVQRLFRRVCGYMTVEPDRVDIELFTDRASAGAGAMHGLGGFAAGTWQGGEGPWQRGV